MPSAAEFYAPFTNTTLASGVTYHYLYTAPSSGSKPHLLFLHGYPSAAWDWRRQIEHFSAAGYGLIVPDLLGYGGTDKPNDPAAYRMKKMAAELAELLDHVGVKTVIGVGHDWGSGMLSGLANFHRGRLQALAFLAVGYIAPAPNYDYHKVSALVESVIGYVNDGYWEFHNEDDAGQTIDEHSDSYTNLIYTDDPDLWRKHLCPFSALKECTTKNMMTPIAPWVSDEDKAVHREIFDPQNGGYGPPTNWYKVMVRKLNNADSAECLKTHTPIQQPVLFLTAKNDVVCVPALQEMATKTGVENCQIKTMDTGHWIQLEAPDETNRLLESFFEEVTTKTET